MKQLINISDMFQDDSFECYNFVLASQDEAIYVDHDHDVIKAYKSEILERMSQGKSYLAVDVEYDHDHILEIQWG